MSWEFSRLTFSVLILLVLLPAGTKSYKFVIIILIEVQNKHFKIL